MEPRIFADGPMGLRHDCSSVPLDRAADLRRRTRTCCSWISSGLTVRTPRDVDAHPRRACEHAHRAIGRKVNAMVNYDRFSIVPGAGGRLRRRWCKGLMDAHYRNGDALHHQRLPAHEARRGAGEAPHPGALLRERKRGAAGAGRGLMGAALAGGRFHVPPGRPPSSHRRSASALLRVVSRAA